MNESLEWVRETWASIPPLYRIVGGLVLFWGGVFALYGRKSVH
jgi:hypothetical protein